MANLEDFLKNFTREGVGVRPPLDPLLTTVGLQYNIVYMIKQCIIQIIDPVV